MSEESEKQLVERERPASEGEAESGQRKAAKRNHRRRRANKRFKPYEVEEVGSVDGEVRRSHRLNAGRPMAPYNTTQFLLDDREERAVVDAADEAAYMARERSRVRSLSVGSAELLFDEASTSGESESDKADETDEHREFEDVYEEVQIDRCARMDRKELTRELMDATKDKDYIIDELNRYKNENGRLRHLLKENGIEPDSSKTAKVA